MAISLGVLSNFLPAEKVTFCNSSSFAVIRLVPTNVRVFRPMTIYDAANPAKETKKREPRGIMKPRRVSPEMQAFLGGVSEIPRTQALKEIWAYIKQHNLQDPTDKKVIICDEKLKKIFGGRGRVGFLEIAGLINPHFLKHVLLPGPSAGKKLSSQHATCQTFRHDTWHDCHVSCLNV